MRAGWKFVEQKLGESTAVLLVWKMVHQFEDKNDSEKEARRKNENRQTQE